MLKDYKPFLGIKKLNGEHFKVGDNVRIALEDVYIIKGGKEQYFGRLGEVEIEGEERIEEILDKTLKKFGIEDYLGKSLLEIVEDEGSFFWEQEKLLMSLETIPLFSSTRSFFWNADILYPKSFGKPVLIKR